MNKKTRRSPQKHIWFKNVFFGLFVLLALSNLVTAQNCDAPYNEAYAAYRSTQWDSAYIKFDIAKTCFKQNWQWGKYYTCNKGMSIILYQQDKSDRIPQMLIPVLDTLNKYADEIEKHRFFSTGIYINIGGAYVGIDNPDEAIHYLNKGLELADNIEQKIKIYSNLGVAYEGKLDYEKAIIYHSRTLGVLSDTFEIKDKNILRINTLNNLGQAYRRHRLYDKALQSFETGLEEVRRFKAEDDSQKWEEQSITGSYYNNIAALYNDWGKYGDALHYLNQLNKIKSSDFHPRYYNNLGYAYLGKKEYARAISAFNQAMQLRENLFPKIKHISKSKTYLSLGETYHAQKKWQYALNNFQQALIQAVPIFNDTSWKENPDIKEAHHVRTLLRILEFKAKTLHEYYQDTQSKDELNAALNAYQTAIQLVDKIRIEQQHDESVFSLLRTARPIYEGAIEAAYAANQPELAYQFMEKSKAVILLTALRDAGAKITSEIPANLLDREKDLKIQISYNKRRLSEAQRADNQAAIKERNFILFEKREELQKLLSKLETDYPEYYAMKYRTDVADIDELQHRLKAEESVAIEYFMGDSSLYACVIDGENMNLYQLAKGADFDTALNDFLSITSNPSTEKNNFINYTSSAAFLYQNLLKSMLPNAKNILIIPDGRLNYLAFDALIQYPLAGEYQESRYDTLSYLLNQYHINYAYSASVLLEKKPEKKSRRLKPFAGFAPDFSSGVAYGRRNLGNLIHNQREVETIQEIMGGSTYIGKLATNQHFFDHADEYHILHFATHVTSGDTIQNTSHQIHLNENPLLADRIYNTSLNADLVVLSACETGQGQLIKGEGVMSLARAFRYTGCPSLAASLWSVDDKSTADIMIDFYKNLHAGEAQHQALTNSKRNYFKTLNTYEKAHPFYWAGFVHVGDTGAISMNNSPRKWLWFVFGGIIILGWWMWRKSYRT